jgi:DNA-binding transcriptional MerR regulator
MKYTVHEVSSLAGVSVRTLHYYHEIGLLTPSSVRENGYREYTDVELARLQQILFFRELEFSLEKIKEVMSSPEYRPFEALVAQRRLLELKQKRITSLLDTLDKTIISMKGDGVMSNDDKFSAFNDPTYQQYKDEAEKRWGLTDAYKQSMERVGKMSESDLKRIKEESDDITKKLAGLFLKEVSPSDASVQEQIDRHYRNISNFYDPGYAMYKGLGQMYVQDPRFRCTYDNYAPGIADFMRDAMTVYADLHTRAV